MRTMSNQNEEESKSLMADDDDSEDDADDTLNFRIDGDDDREEVRYEIREQGYSGDVSRPTTRNIQAEPWEADLQSERRVVGGAAAAGAIAGLLLAGPVGALLVAGGLAAVATTRGKAGEVTRASGEVMAQAGDRLHNFDRKHGISKKAGSGFIRSANWVSEKLKPQHERERDAAFDLTS
jgi:hypothetical protein